MAVAAKPNAKTKASKPRELGPDEAIIAERDRALALLELLVALVPATAFAPDGTWDTLHEANALLAVHGRGTPDRFAAARAAGFATREKAGR